MKRLKTLFVYDDFYQQLFLGMLVVISFLIGVMLVKIWLIVLSLVLYLFLFYKKPKLAIIVMVVLGICFISKIINQQQALFIKTDQYVIVNKKKGNDKYQYVIKKKQTGYFLYLEEDLDVGTVMIISGEYQAINGGHYQGDTDFAKIMSYQKIYGIIKADEYHIIKKQFVISLFQAKVCDFYEKYLHDESLAFLQAMFLGIKSDFSYDLSFNDNLNYLGVSHLFVVSGTQVYVLLFIVRLFFKKRGKKISEMVTLTCYVIITNLSISVVRVFISFVLKESKKVKRLSGLDLFSLNVAVVVIVNPFYLLQLSFVMSYIITFFIIVGSVLLNRYQTVIRKTFFTAFYCILVSLPLVIYLNNQVNILAVLFNVLYLPLISFLYFPLSLIVMILPFLDIIYYPLIIIFIQMTSFFSNWRFLTISFGNMTIFLGLIYYLLLILFYYHLEMGKKKVIYGSYLIIYLFVLCFQGYSNLSDEVVFMDLPKGEATLIRGAFNSYNLLVDTGDYQNKAIYDITRYLMRQGIKKIDYLFISHSDADHIGGLSNIIKYIKVDYLIFSKHESADVINQYAHLVKNVYLVGATDQLKKANVSVDFLFPTKMVDADINDNSMVMIVDIRGFKILFTGDIEQPAEQRLIEEKIIKSLKINILKVAHHGSKTSSTVPFLKQITYEYAIVMNGYYNTFGFPHLSVIDRLDNVLVSSEKKTIVFKRFFLNDHFKLQNS